MLNEMKKLALSAIAVATTVALVAPAAAQETRTIKGERYSPTIWVDPDGCEHWVMDDGAEGYMTPHVTPDGKPVCRLGQLCGMMPTDQFFATDKHYINSTHRKRIVEFFEKTRANTRAYVIAGHTDSRASDEYNIALSQRRANAVAKIARTVSGVRVADVRAYGERDPRKPNNSAKNMAENRRVEIYCLR
ncbi:Outer membrane porin F precursor [Tritonibacter multivorans]|uniref:Outer membrane porin F n=1 Tax=Tritonibacter multivorans TaxID=928856 RepID=A0A0P1G1Z0_9RHOB|nr:Outer membrane porin F precursor [Tritonibacter multivorans]SFC61207.1 OmpA family protein [Tritonibacter multivorans]